jgi:hypothetical protein
VHFFRQQSPLLCGWLRAIGHRLQRLRLVLAHRAKLKVANALLMASLLFVEPQKANLYGDEPLEKQQAK